MNKNILITGASSGLGKATALKLAQEGYKVFAGVRKEADKTTLETLHENITAIYLDVTDENSVNEAFDVVTQNTDDLFAIINSAGIALGGPVEFLPIETLKKQFDVNVFGAIRVVQRFFSLLNNDDARVVNISSMASYGVFPFISPYCTSKRTLDMFFNSLLIENKHPNLKIISIKPGVVSTPIWNKSVDACEKTFENVSDSCRTKYEKELLFLAENARKNTQKGLVAEDVANLIDKVLKTKKPKLSYNIGKDSYIARILSFLPQDLCNKLVKLGLNNRLKPLL